MRTTRFLQVAIALACAAVAGALAGGTGTLAFEAECLDLDSGVVAAAAERPPGWDLLASYHADRSVRAVVFHNRGAGVEVAHLEGVSFDEVTPDDVAQASFSVSLVDEPFASDRVILVRTDLGAVYKLGNPLEQPQGLSFDHELLLPAP